MMASKNLIFYISLFKSNSIENYVKKFHNSIRSIFNSIDNFFGKVGAIIKFFKTLKAFLQKLLF